ncbi:hypothetical protein NIES267_36460 [Calothrix parasitica NIES-267]|uniref:Uncharacterized protein n=1 Tax=Calothrix parasitica NIES-267 TaxID=1973488 RepID=A0A1Z4LSC5_9CYAN|nr:hypothetical protein NIES267_36460 [Calothrix parasitica NIES-267]
MTVTTIKFELAICSAGLKPALKAKDYRLAVL